MDQAFLRLIFALVVIAVVVTVESIVIRMFLKIRDRVRRALARRHLKAKRRIPDDENQDR